MSDQPPVVVTGPGENESERDVALGDERSVLLDQVRQRRQEILSTDYYKDVDIPGYLGMLVARFRPYTASKSERHSKSLRQRVERDEPVILDVSCQTLIDACEQVMVRKGRDTEPMPIDDEVPVKFDARLAELLRIDLGPAGGARAVVKALFPTEQAVIATAMEVDQWLRDVTREADSVVLGE